jgi:predicted ATPase
LAPITVFAGANSSGKSTFLQSFLLLKQTLQYGASNRALSLNGPLLRLGTADDVVHYGDSDPELAVAFDFRLENWDITLSCCRFHGHRV